jgi:hypothetical protein
LPADALRLLEDQAHTIDVSRTKVLEHLVRADSQREQSAN